jgi:hypothetical protein
MFGYCLFCGHEKGENPLLKSKNAEIQFVVPNHIALSSLPVKANQD